MVLRDWLEFPGSNFSTDRFEQGKLVLGSKLAKLRQRIKRLCNIFDFTA